MKKDSAATAKLYNKFAQFYHDSRSAGSSRLPNEFIDIPTTLALLPKKIKGLKILDAGCGSGIYTRLIAGRGGHVTGVDISTEIIRIAKEQTPKNLHVSYLVGDLYDLPAKKNNFDIVICNYVLEYVKDLPKAFSELYRVLKPGGICIFSISHPLKKQSTKSFSKNRKEVWVLEDYYAGGIIKSDFGGGMTISKYKRPIEAFMQALRSVGFLVSDFREPRPLPQGKKAHPKEYAAAMRLPQLLTLKLVKLK